MLQKIGGLKNQNKKQRNKVKVFNIHQNYINPSNLQENESVKLKIEK